MNEKHIQAEHGIVCAMPDDFLGYFGWPSVDIMADGTLVVVASGLRNGHMCPFGRTIICTSRDNGQSWTMPRVVNDTPLDDRDAGVVTLGQRRLLITWFTADRRPDYQGYMTKTITQIDPTTRERWMATTAAILPEHVHAFEGSWVRYSPDGGDTWEAPVRVPVSSPHGCIRLLNGHLLYLGKMFLRSGEQQAASITAIISSDDGHSWERLGSVPLAPHLHDNNCYEPHVVELPSGRLLGMVRVQSSADCDMAKVGYVPFSIFRTVSDDGGRTWSPMEPLGIPGSPPHIIRQSSGALILSYGYRLQPYGQRVAISIDDGVTWDHDWILRVDGPDADLGYPCTVELPDGSLFTVYYQKPKAAGDKCALLWSRWELPL